MRQAMTLIFSNFTVTLLVVGLVVSLLSIARQSRPLHRPAIVEALLSWFLFFSIGVSFFYNFVMHVFFSDLAASYIGWQTSPFQKEVGFASLGFAAAGFLAFRGAVSARLAALIGPACFLWGAAVGHAVQIVDARNYAPGNAGTIFYTDIFLPLIGLVLLALSRPAKRLESFAR